VTEISQTVRQRTKAVDHVGCVQLDQTSSAVCGSTLGTWDARLRRQVKADTCAHWTQPVVATTHTEASHY